MVEMGVVTDGRWVGARCRCVVVEVPEENGMVENGDGRCGSGLRASPSHWKGMEVRVVFIYMNTFVGMMRFRMWRLKLGLTLLGFHLARETACGWFGPETVSCQFGGVCLPNVICPTENIFNKWVSLGSLYKAYGRILAATSHQPALTCLKHKLNQAPMDTVVKPLSTVMSLESRGLTLASTIARTMKGLESDVVVPAYDVGLRIEHYANAVESALNGVCGAGSGCDDELVKIVHEIQHTLAKECLDISFRISNHSSYARAISNDLAVYSDDIQDFAMELSMK